MFMVDHKVELSKVYKQKNPILDKTWLFLFTAQAERQLMDFSQ